MTLPPCKLEDIHSPDLKFRLIHLISHWRIKRSDAEYGYMVRKDDKEKWKTILDTTNAILYDLERTLNQEVAYVPSEPYNAIDPEENELEDIES